MFVHGEFQIIEGSGSIADHGLEFRKIVGG